MATQIKASITTLQEVKKQGAHDVMPKLEVPDVNYARTMKIVHTKTLDANGHKNKIYAVDIGSGDAHRKQAISAGQDPQVIVWKISKGTKLGELNFFRDNKKKREANWISTLNWQRDEPHNIAVGTTEGIIKVFPNSSISNGVTKPLFQRKAHIGIVNSVKFMPGLPGMVLSCGDDWSLHLNNVEAETEPSQVALGHDDFITEIAVHESHPHGAVTASVDHTCRLWDFREKKREVGKFVSRAEVNDVKFNGSGNSIALALENGTAQLFDIRFMSRPRFTYFKSQEDIIVGGPISNVCFTAQGGLLVASYNKSIVACNAILEDENGSCDKLLAESNKDHNGRITSVVPNHNDGKSFLTGSFDKKVKVWKARERKRR